LNKKERMRKIKSVLSGRLDTEVVKNHIVNTGNFEDEVVQKEIRKFVLKAISKLKKSPRKAIMLYYFQGSSCTEISEILNKPLNTIKTELSRGREN
jgi:RNA polymerase sigma-70 factor (ECF subfamily)